MAQFKESYSKTTSVTQTKKVNDKTYKVTETVSQRQVQPKSFRQSNSGIFDLVTSLSTYIIVMVIIVLAGTTTFYTENKENLTWLNDDNTFNENSYDLYRSYGLNTPLDDLNGYSLKEVFEDFNLVQIDDFFPINATADETAINESVLTTNASSSYVAYRNNISTINNNIYYLRVSVKVDWVDSTKIEMPSSAEGYVGITNPISNTYYDLSHKYTSIGYSFIQFIFRGNNTIGDLSYVKDVYFLNLTDLGINQTKAEMDYWYSEYQTLNNEVDLDTFKLLGNIPVSNYETLGQVITSVVDTMDAFLSGWIDFYETILSIF